MNRNEIIKDYIKFCNDTKRNANDRKNRKIYAKNLALYMLSFGQISIDKFENTMKEIENILKYNTLTIATLTKKA